MGRGKPVLWSALLSLPFLGSAVGLFLVDSHDITVKGLTMPSSSLQLFSIPLSVFGIFIIILGIYAQVVSPKPPRFRNEEYLVDTRHPSQRVAFAKIAMGFPLLTIAGYLLFFTIFPYVYPTTALLAGLYYFSSGIKTYWVNTLTTYYVTNQRVISEYRFISLRRQGLPLDKLRGVEERRSIMEALVGLGNIRVASAGGGGSVQLVMRNMGNSSDFAEELRNLMT